MRCFLNFMGFDFIAEVDYRVTSYGSPAHMGSLSYPGDPGEPPEFEIDSIFLCEDLPTGKDGPVGPAFEATGALFDCLADLPSITEQICEAICKDGPPDYDDY